MLFSNNVSDYIPLMSVDKATNIYKESCEKNNVLPSFLQDLGDREIIQARYFANALYIHPLMFENWLKKHKNKQGRPFQKEGYMDTIDVRKYLEETEKYYLITHKDVEMMFENHLFGTPIFLEKNQPYVLESKVESFCEKEKLFCHMDIIQLIEKYIDENFGKVSAELSEILGFDIHATGSLIYRNYLNPMYFSDSKTNNTYLVTKEQVDRCMENLELLIQKNAKLKKQQLIEKDFNYRFTTALEHKAMVVNKLKPFNPPSKNARWKHRKQLQEKFEAIEKLKIFLSNEIENIDINTDMKAFMAELKYLIPYDFNKSINSNFSKLYTDKVNIPFDREIEMYEDALLDEKKIF